MQTHCLFVFLPFRFNVDYSLDTATEHRPTKYDDYMAKKKYPVNSNT